MSAIVLSPFLKFIPKIILIKIHLDFNTLYTHLSLIKRKPDFAYDKTKAQISFAVTAKLICVFVFVTRIVRPLFFLNTKYQDPSHLP